MMRIFQKIFYFILSATLVITNIQPVHAQPAAPGISGPADPLLFKGLIVNASNPWQIDFIVDAADEASNDSERRISGAEEFPQRKAANAASNDSDPNTTHQEILKLTKYFLAGLTLPEEDLWVNLSPAEPDRILPESLSRTSLGNDLLELDYQLKQLTASLLHPDNEHGKKFWEAVYGQQHMAYGENQTGSSAYQLPFTPDQVETFNKVWIVPASAVVYEQNGKALVIENRLKVMLESDYEAQSAESRSDVNRISTKVSDDAVKNIIRQHILPVIENEINNGATFANLRQIYNSLLLATWYKTRLKESILNASYADHKNTNGIEIADASAKEKIYQQYLDIFRTGATDIIKEEYNPEKSDIETRRYFTGGLKVNYKTDAAMMVTQKIPANLAISPNAKFATINLQHTLVNAAMLTVKKIIEKNPRIKLSALARKMGFASIKDPGFIAAFKDYLKSSPKSTTVFASGLIFPEDLLDFLLDAEPVQGEAFSPEESISRLESRQKARRRFVAYLEYKTEHGPEADLKQFDQYLNSFDNRSENKKFYESQDINRIFKEYLGISSTANLDEKIKTPDVINRFKGLLNHKSDQTLEWENFEKYIKLSYIITDTDPSFRPQIMRRSLLRYCKEQNVKQIDIISNQEDPLESWVPPILKIEDAPQLTIGLIKSFRRNYLSQVNSEAGQDIYSQLLSEFSDKDLETTRSAILDRTLALDKQEFGFTDKTIASEFNAFFEELKRQLGKDATERQIKTELIRHYTARKLAIKQFKSFEKQLADFKITHPAYKSHIAGIAFLGEEHPTDFWILAPLYRRAKEQRLKIISFAGNEWQSNSTPEDMMAYMDNMMHLADIGFNSVGNGAIIGADFENTSLFRDLTQTHREQLVNKQKQLLKKLKQKGISLLLMPSSLKVRLRNNPQFSIERLTQNLDDNLLPLMIGSGNPSILQQTVVDEITDYALSFPNMPVSKVLDILEQNDSRRLYKDHHAFLATFKKDLETIYEAEQVMKPAIPSLGSARFKSSHRYYKAARKFAYLLGTQNIGNESGAGPGIMEAVQRGHDRARLKNRILQFFQGVRIMLNIFEPKNKKIKVIYDLKHFALRKYLLLRLMQPAFVAFPGGLGTEDENLEAIRKDQPLFLYGKDYWTEIVETRQKIWDEFNIHDENETPPIFDNVEEMIEAVVKIWKEKANEPVRKLSREEIDLRFEEGKDAVNKFKHTDAITIFGNPSMDSESGKEVLQELREYVSSVLDKGTVFRIANPEIFDVIYDLALEKTNATGRNFFQQIQMIRYKGHRIHGHTNTKGLTTKEQTFLNNYPNNSVVFEEGPLGEYMMQIFSTFDSSGAVFLPGDSYVLNEFFSFVVTRQTGTTMDRPVGVLGYEKFYKPLWEKIYSKFLEEATINEDDQRFFKAIKNSDDFNRVCGLNNKAMMAQPVGGIDLKSSDIFRIEGEGSDVFKNAQHEKAIAIETLTPVLVNVRPAGNVQELFTVPVQY